VDGSVVTAAGVSAGIDMALWLAAQLAGTHTARMLQLAIEYDPEPPYRSGSPGQAGRLLAAVGRRAVRHAFRSPLPSA
jgi:cyclohexyl-isocyanide hydratase